MILTLKPGASRETIAAVFTAASRFEGVTPRTYTFQGIHETVTEVHLLGDTAAIPEGAFSGIPGVRRVVRVSKRYRLIGRHGRQDRRLGFEYRGIPFDESRVHLFAGLCAVDSRGNVERMMAALQALGITTTRMGAYKPRTSPYDFQGLGKRCLPWVFELAGRYGIQIVAMEVCDERHIEEIRAGVEAAGNPTGVMLQIGTRNTQNFELLKHAGQQREMPVLFKRGMGITLEESLNACEYVAAEGQPNIVFCLRGVKTHLGDPHRNLADFAHVPVVRAQTRLPVCIDPSHSIGRARRAPDGLPEVFHVTGQGVIAGASMVLVDFHPDPPAALCDGPQALTLDELPLLAGYIGKIRRTYEEAVRAFSPPSS
ncbi:MAG: 3-deoxy-7-phosphoheptulonate synthase [Planctomycetota bacterium]